MLFKSYSFVLLLLVPFYLFGQIDYDKKLSRNRSHLNALKKDISDIKVKLSTVKKKESSYVEQLALIDKQTALISHSKGLLKQENRLLKGKIEQNNKQLKVTKNRYSNLKELYGKRMVYIYKYGRMRDLELLLTSNSFNQAFIRYRYLQEIAKHDERTIRSIQKKKREIENLRRSLSETLILKKKNLTEKEKQETAYTKRKKEKSAALKKIRWSQAAYDKQLTVKQKETENLIQLILNLENQKQLSQRDKSRPSAIDFKFDKFIKTKGKLPWPVNGKVVTRYGKVKDPNSKTYVKNTDIEIKSSLGTPVRCVFKGVARVITYLPGYGNTVIVDHGSGYYTVYSHLDEIYVHQDDGIKTSQVIATVGDSGSLAGAKLQFGIYGKQDTYNPELWLSKQ